MIIQRTAGSGDDLTRCPDVAVVDHAVAVIHRVCCIASCFELLQDLRDPALAAAVERHDTGALFDRLMYDVSFQGISDTIAVNYMAKHGQATWRAVRKNLANAPSCPKLQSYWRFTAATKRPAAAAPSLTTLRPAPFQLIAYETAI